MSDHIKQPQAVTEAAVGAATQDKATEPLAIVPGTTTPSKEAVSVGAKQVQKKVDAENATGYRGHNPDPTPNSHYTVAGVLAGKPTPETDADMAAQGQHALRYGTTKKEK